MHCGKKELFRNNIKLYVIDRIFSRVIYVMSSVKLMLIIVQVVKNLTT